MPKRIAPNPAADSPIDESATTPTASAVLEQPAARNGWKPAPSARKTRQSAPPANGRHFTALPPDDHSSNRQAELFYLQKQIQLQTQMVFILEDGARVQGIVEWYDRQSIKVRGKSKMLIYKSAIKYLYKAGEVGSAPAE